MNDIIDSISYYENLMATTKDAEVRAYCDLTIRSLYRQLAGEISRDSQ